MYKLIFQVIGVGLLFGFLGSVSAMLMGIMIYFAASAVDLFLPIYFLRYAAVISLIFGISCAAVWYGYILYLAKYYISFMIKNIFD